MKIHQISVVYVQEQDRCLVRINSLDGEELRLWFTRRLSLELMPCLHEVASAQLRQHTTAATAALPTAVRRTELLESFQKEAQIFDGDFQTPFKPQPAALPLGAEPLLITGIKLALQASGTVDLQLTEKSGQQVRNIALAMHPQLVQGLLRLLTAALKKSQWQVLPPLAGESAVATGDTPAALLQDHERPKYLN